jgi:hypothetical protein
LRHLGGEGFSGHSFTFDRKGQATKSALQDAVARMLTLLLNYKRYGRNSVTIISMDGQMVVAGHQPSRTEGYGMQAG